MTHLPLLASAMLLAVTVLGVWLDMRRVEVPGWLTVAGVLLGVGLNQFLFGVQGLVLAAAGAALAVAASAALHVLRIADFGRLKLMVPVGAIVGPRNWLLICGFSVLLGVPIAIFVAFRTARLRQTGATKALIIRDFLQFLPPYQIANERRALSHHGLIMRHSSLIAIGVLLFLAITAVWASR